MARQALPSIRNGARAGRGLKVDRSAQPRHELDDLLGAFKKLQTAVAACDHAASQEALVDRFVARYPQSPLIGSVEAVIWYDGPGEVVLLRGDMLQERSEPLQRLGRTRLRYQHGHYESEARLDYHLLVDGQDVGDPRNQRQAPSGYGPRGELRMPGYAVSELWQPRADVPAGTITAFADVASGLYPSTRTIWVYTPPGYQTTERYPSVFFHDGGDYLRFGQTQALFDNLIAAGLLPPCIGVFVNPSREHGRVVDYDLNPGYARFFADELVPWIDQRYAISSAPAQRVIVGASFGGLIALWIALQRPDLFGCVAAQSSFVSRRDDALIKLFQASPRVPLKIHLMVGSYETHIGPFDRDSGEANFLRGNRALHRVLQAKGYPVAYADYPEGHSWGLWRARLGAALQFLLSPSSIQAYTTGR